MNSGPSPVPGLGPRRRVLIEAADGALRRAATRVLETAGFQVSACAGPDGEHRCPVLSRRTCPLVAGADVIVHALPGPRGQAVLERIRPTKKGAGEILVLTGRGASPGSGGTDEMPAAAPGPALVEAVFRLHGHRVRLLRTPLTLGDGRRVTVRAVRPSDARKMRAFDASLSPQSRQFRYHGTKPPMTTDWAKHLTTLDFEGRFALVATAGPATGERIVADCRLILLDPVRAELAIAVADDYHGAGLGRRLVELTLEVAAARGQHQVVADVRYDNRPMALLLGSEGFARVGGDLGVMTFLHSQAGPVQPSDASRR